MARRREHTNEQREREGSLRADRHADEPPIAPAGEPEMPSSLLRPERDAWGEITGAMRELGVLSAVDATTIEGAAHALARARKASRESSKLSTKYRYYEGHGGNLKPHPALAEERAAWALYHSIAKSLGLSQAGRSTLRITGRGDAEAESSDPLERIAEQIRNMPTTLVE